jgi:transposase
VAQAWHQHHRRWSERRIAGNQGGAPGIPRRAFPSLTRRADAPRSRLPSVFPPRRRWRDTRLLRFQGANRYNSFTYKLFGNGATLDNGFLVLSKIGRLAVRWSRPVEGTPKTITISREVDGWYACFSCAEVPTQPLPLTGQETGIDLELEAFATLADGNRIANPRHCRTAEKRLAKTQRRVSRRRRGAIEGARR